MAAVKLQTSCSEQAAESDSCLQLCGPATPINSLLVLIQQPLKEELGPACSHSTELKSLRVDLLNNTPFTLLI